MRASQTPALSVFADSPARSLLMDVVPFHFDAYGGLGTVQGLARIDELGLELQFSTRDTLFGVLKSGQRSLQVPLAALLSVRYCAGFLWLMPRIELRVRDLSTLRELPESEQGRVTLSLAFRDRHDGRAFAADLELMRSRHRTLQLERMLDRMVAPLPETPTELPATDAARERDAHRRRDAGLSLQ
jgi:hypothetical protein